MQVERAKLLVTLRTNGRTYKAGRVFLAPDIPQCIIQEIRANTGTVEAYGVSNAFVDTERVPTPPVEETMIAPPAEPQEIVDDGSSIVVDGGSSIVVEDEPEEKQEEETGDGEEEQEEEEVRKPAPKVVKRSQRRR